ncbi:putative secreted protein with PEP-CTERM sorting signal [Rhodothalassium salexigens DSM 2132]|uniref:Putative secreted protein with PEP-CTERM sorting signal n=2 Tax=Rhodothalassium salexigens TaxID=1086 RepID=A0A4R2PQC0_RHOSA|nr:putative secreted protein with PEP-CTERM sorting signal [Rhodothalassium salexigens DSM 2132]
MKNLMKPLVGGAFLALSGTAQASIITDQTFDSDPVLADSRTDGAWFVDRSKPAGFSSVDFMGDKRLALTISSDHTETDLFRFTQGRQFLTPGARMISIDWYLDPAFQNTTGRVGGLWGVGFGGDPSGVLSYPIIEFFEDQFHVWDSVQGDDDGSGFRPAGLPDGVAFGEFVNMEIQLDPTADLFRFFLNDTLLGTEEAGGTTEIGSVILQAVNTADGIDRTLYFDNFVARSSIPVPATGLMLLIGVAGAAALGRRARQA